MNKQTTIEAAPTLAFAMSEAFGAIQAATKDSRNPHYKSKYADLSAVIDAIKPALVDRQLFFTQRTEPVERGVQVETVLHHANGEEMSLGKLFVPANKQDAQGFGSALTYARRYALVTAFGVPVEDDDGEAARKAPAEKRAVSLKDETWAELVQLIGATGTDAAKVCEAKGVDSLKALSEDVAQGVIKTLTARLANQSKGNNNG